MDQYRGFALVLVLISHGLYFVNQSNGIGRVGVNLFFFISGILVFRSLHKPATSRGIVETALSFWKRRVLRLAPALFAYLAAIGLVVYVLQDRPGLPPLSTFADYVHALPSAIFFAVDFFPNDPTAIGHLWSVAVEMQFYLIAPIVYFLGGRSNTQRSVVWSAILVVLLICGVTEPLHGYQERYAFQVTVWPMMLGFLLEYKKSVLNRLSRRRIAAAICIGWGIVLATLVMMLFSAQKVVVVAAGAVIFVPCFLSYISDVSMPGWWGRGLGWLGERTYSVYLWQQPLTLCGYVPGAFQAIGAACSPAIGAVWYALFERPMLSGKRKSIT